MEARRGIKIFFSRNLTIRSKCKINYETSENIIIDRIFVENIVNKIIFVESIFVRGSLILITLVRKQRLK